MTIAEATPDFEDRGPSDRAFLGHPKGLGYLAFVEGCERFSYYSMQTLLMLYMVRYLLLPENASGVIGLDWLKGYYGFDGQPLASKIFGDYTSLVYLTPIAGGFIADRWLGRRMTLILGGLLMTLGHFLMAFESSFLFALIALIVGVGLFKGNIASQVGELYKPEDLRRAMAFQIFYIAINVSVIVAPLVAGTLGEKVGWHWGFGTAGVVMVIGLILYIMAGPWLPTEKRTPKVAGANAAKEPLVRQDWLRIVAVVALVPILAVALLTNQQIFNAYIVWADTEFDLSLPAALANLSFQMWLPFLGERVIGLPNPLPTSWMITIDAIASFLMLAAVAAFYIWYGKKRQEPDELGKMIIGSFFTIAGGLCLYMAAVTQGSGKIGLFWPLMFHLFNSIGFAHILPVSLAFFTKLAPKAINATIVGIYYLSFFGANKIVGEVGTWYETMATPTFWLFHVGTAVVGLIAFVIFKLFLAKRLLGG